MKKMLKKSEHQGFVIPIIIIVMIIAMIIIGGFCVAFVGGRQGAGHTGEMIGGEGESGQNSADFNVGDMNGIGCNNVPIFIQGANPWGNQSYGCGDTTIGDAGCGVSAAAMVLKFYGKNVDPGVLAKLSLSNGYRVCGSGTSYGFFPFIAQRYGLKNENSISWGRAMTLLKQGKPIIASGKGPVPFTSGGHYIVLTCYNSDGTISVNDSAGGKHPAQSKYPEALIRKHKHFLSAIY